MGKTKTAVQKAADRETRRMAEIADASEGLESNDAALIPEDLKDLESDEKLAVFHQKFGGEDYKIRVEKFNREENEWESVTNLKLATFDSFDSLKKYGAGKYRMSLLDNGGHYVAGGRMEARISAAAIEAEKAAAPTTPAPDAGLNLMVTMLQAQNQQNLELMKAMLGRPVAENKGPGISELIAGMAGIRNLMPKEEGGLGGIKGTLELMKLMKDLQPDDRGGEEGGIMGELAQAVELFSKVSPLIAAKQAARAGVVPANPKLAAPVPTNMATGAVAVPTPDAPAMEAEPDHMKPIIDKAQSYVPQLVAWASRGKDVEDAADFILDEIENEIVPLLVANFKPGGMTLSPAFVFGELVKRGQDPAQVEAIFTHAPALVPYKEWFTRVIAKAVEFAHADDETPEPNGNVEATNENA